jgi:hypothetical protein
MKLEYKGHEIEIYDSILEMPISRYNLYNRFAIIDSGVGNDLNDFVSKCNRIVSLIDRNTDKAKIEVDNLVQLVMLQLKKNNPEQKSFASLVKRINGRTYPVVLTDDHIEDILEKLSNHRVPVMLLRKWLGVIKKKSKMN